jgi:hypothetical protein
MNIYLVERTDNWGYDNYTAMVVIAKNPKEAKEYTIKTHEISFGWTIAKNLKVKLVGTSKAKRQKIILESFNAG